MAVNRAWRWSSVSLQRQADVARRGADVVDPSAARDVVPAEVRDGVGGEVIPRQLLPHVPVEVLGHRPAAERPVLWDFKS